MTDPTRSRPGMSTRTGAELQAARRAAAERFTTIAMAHVPEGWTVEYHKGRAHCNLTEKRIRSQRPVTRRALCTFLHECAHGTSPCRQAQAAARRRDGGREVGLREDARARCRRPPQAGEAGEALCRPQDQAGAPARRQADRPGGPAIRTMRSRAELRLRHLPASGGTPSIPFLTARLAGVFLE
jgi:hypothetical protein